MVNGVGVVLTRNLLSEFDKAEEIFKASKKKLIQIDGINEKTAESIKKFDDWELADQELLKIEKWGISLLTLNDPDYPKALFQTYNPPLLLYVKGEIIERDEISMAIVGSRLPDRYGRTVAQTLSGELASLGITIVSGLARGIDSFAHEAAIKAGGRTIGILGCGLDQIYPPENKKLYTEVSQNGAVISEFNLGTPPIAQNFPRRNRIISGLSLGVVVVQASEKSGSLISASFALDQNKEVFAVPGHIDHKLSRGTHWLIKRGAKLVETVDDIINEIDSLRSLQGKDLFEEDRRGKILATLTKSQKEVFSVLSSDPVHIDEINKLTGIEPSSLLSTLLTLELNDVVVQLPGKHSQIK